jgi:hypothetical protein
MATILFWIEWPNSAISNTLRQATPETKRILFFKRKPRTHALESEF